MEDNYTFNNCRIHYKLVGDGNCIVLIHGYLENLNIWDGFADQLSKHYQVLILDLPQNGKSECNEEVNSIERMAESVNAILIYLNIKKAVIMGHSMGGYVALAFAELFSSSVEGLCLINSSPNADSNEKKRSRLEDISLVMKGEKHIIIEKGVPLRFANKNLSKYKREVEWTKDIALTTSDSGVISSLKAMATRNDRNHVIEHSIFPTIMIFGALDNLIPLNLVNELANRHKKTRIVILNNSGHMSFIEEKDQTVSAIKSFLAEVFS
jgi:pimeloyl-ACP methyl ester carboxylesterase